jgi:PEP-CTERM motif
MIFIKEIASLGAAMLIGLSAPSAEAGYVVDLTQQGSDVVATGSGPIDLTGLSFGGSLTNDLANITPSFGGIHTGPTLPVNVDTYTGITGPTSFGSGFESFPSSGSGDFVGVEQGFFLIVPLGYVSGNPLSDTSTYSSQTFSSVGVTPGTYKWTWGPGANQNFTLVIGTVVPEPSTWAMMALGFAVLGLAGYRVRAAATSNV